jgi:hypothetical protein
VQGVCVIGIGCQQSLTTKLGFEKLPRLEIAMASLTLRSGRECLRFLGPAFSAVHWHGLGRGSVFSR